MYTVHILLYHHSIGYRADFEHADVVWCKNWPWIWQKSSNHISIKTLWHSKSHHSLRLYFTTNFCFSYFVIVQVTNCLVILVQYGLYWLTNLHSSFIVRAIWSQLEAKPWSYVQAFWYRFNIQSLYNYLVFWTWQHCRQRPWTIHTASKKPDIFWTQNQWNVLNLVSNLNYSSIK